VRGLIHQDLSLLPVEPVVQPPISNVTLAATPAVPYVATASLRSVTGSVLNVGKPSSSKGTGERYIGESVLHPVIARKVIDHYTSSAGKPAERDKTAQLSDRELEVLRLAAKGMSNRDIALDLHLSVRTVQAHLSTIFSKMEVGSRTEAVVRALREGWLSFDDTL
jgi:DNA-binding NarL/FixJ family response regulator